MTIQIVVKNYSELRTLAEQILSGEQWKESPGITPETANDPEPEAVPEPEATPEPEAVPEPVATPEPAREKKGYTLDDLTHAAIALIDAGKKNDLQELLKKYGAPALPALDKGQFEAFAGDLRDLGAEI